MSAIDWVRVNYDNMINYVKAKQTLKKLSKFLSGKGVKLIYVELPTEKKIRGLTSFEKDRIDNWCFDFNQYTNELPKLKQIYCKDVTQEYILSVFDGGTVVQGSNRKILLDFQSENQHIINGRRITTDQPSVYHNTVYTHGACTWRGTGVEDKQTIASYLQRLINNEYPNSYKVINSAIGRGSDIFDDYESIMEQDYCAGDIVIIGSHGPYMAKIKPSFYASIGIQFIETSSCFNRPHNYGEWFNDATVHTNFRGNKVLADTIFKALQSQKWLTIEGKRHKDTPIMTESLMKGEKIYGDNPELLKFIESLKSYDKGAGVNGSIVMNCNPFTLGHRYLIEYAASQVDYLYIFVVEENKSYFTFEDRLDLVRKGTSDLGNVIVLPSGNFIISATTFPGYFYKDNLKEAKIDCSNDLSVFAQYIAPALHIKIRFAGEEPLDPITNQYNEGMKEILPKYGIEFRAIPRKQDDEGIGVISASRVRKYFDSGQLEEIKKIVPSTTYDYLVNRYKKEHKND